MRDPESSMAVRLGISAVLEEFHGTGLTDALIPGLAELSRSGDALTRADACHFLSLIGGEAVIPHLRASLEDEDGEVRAIAQEALGI
jgi:HEAT repeat protein